MIHGEIRALVQYWEALRAGRSSPFRAEIDPRAMTCNVRHLFILEDLGHSNLRFRLAGTALAEAFGMELRGMSARSIMDMAARESFAELIAETLAEPGIGYARLSRSTAPHERWEVVLLPLRSDFGRVDRVLGALHALEPGKELPAGASLRFSIDDMDISPVEITHPDEPGPVPGFAEPQASFQHRRAIAPLPQPKKPDGPVRSLTAIEGGKASDGDAEGEPRPSRRSHLRIVKND